MHDSKYGDRHAAPSQARPLSRGRWSIRRASDRRVAPLEIWNLPFGGSNLHGELSADRVAAELGRGQPAAGACLFERVVSAASMLRARMWHEASDAADFKALLLGGGLTDAPGFAQAAAGAALPFRVIVGGFGRFFGARAGFAMLQRHGVRALHPLAADAGQTSVKTALPGAGSEPRAFPRDAGRVPVVLTEHAAGLGPDRSAALAREAISFIAASIAAGAAGSEGPVDAIALGLPCELDEKLVPGGCTYPGIRGMQSLVFDVLEEAGRTAPDFTFADEVEVLVANDAELSGYGALDALSEEGFRGKALVVSLGFGPGAAVVRL